MPHVDPLDYGDDAIGSPLVPPWAGSAFAKGRSVEVEPAFQGELIFQRFSFWTMYDYFRALALLVRGASWDEREGACNLLAIRGMDSRYRQRANTQGEFNDILVVVRETQSEPEIYVYECSIDPGGKDRKARGGQLVLENGVHNAVVGKRGRGIGGKGAGTPVVILTDFQYRRDKNYDGVPDTDVIHGSRAEGVQIHWSSAHAKSVGRYSAGCTAVKTSLEGPWKELIGLLKGHARAWGGLRYLVSSCDELRTPGEIFEQNDFWDLLGHISRTPFVKTNQAIPPTSGIPVAPAGADVDANIKEAQEHKWNALWFREKVRNNREGREGSWDYKQAGEAYQDFGNFNFGATGKALGIPEDILLKQAGHAQVAAGTSKPEWGEPATWGILGGTAPFGDDPDDQAMIKKGIDYYKKNYEK